MCRKERERDRSGAAWPTHNQCNTKRPKKQQYARTVTHPPSACLVCSSLFRSLSPFVPPGALRLTYPRINLNIAVATRRLASHGLAHRTPMCQPTIKRASINGHHRHRLTDRNDLSIIRQVRGRGRRRASIHPRPRPPASSSVEGGGRHNARHPRRRVQPAAATQLVTNHAPDGGARAHHRSARANDPGAAEVRFDRLRLDGAFIFYSSDFHSTHHTHTSPQLPHTHSLHPSQRSKRSTPIHFIHLLA